MRGGWLDVWSTSPHCREQTEMHLWNGTTNLVAGLGRKGWHTYMMLQLLSSLLLDLENSTVPSTGLWFLNISEINEGHCNPSKACSAISSVRWLAMRP